MKKHVQFCFQHIPSRDQECGSHPLPWEHQLGLAVMVAVPLHQHPAINLASTVPQQTHVQVAVVNGVAMVLLHHRLRLRLRLQLQRRHPATRRCTAHRLTI